MRFGLTLPNRGVLFGVTTPEQMLRMAQLADESDVFQSVWVGDSLLGKPRMESVALLGWIEVVNQLWTKDNVTFTGKHYQCSGISIDPKPAAKPRPPIWIANNPPARDQEAIRRTLRRVVNHADGWETSLHDPNDVGWR